MIEELPVPLDEFAKIGEIVDLPKDAILKKQFSRVDRFYILLEGSVHFHQTLQSKNQKLLAGMSQSRFAPIGMDAFIVPFRNETTASVASDSARLIQWDTDKLIAFLEESPGLAIDFFHYLNVQSHQFITDTSQLFANTSAALQGTFPDTSSEGYVSHMEHDEIDRVILLLQSPFFEEFEEEDLTILAQNMERREYLKGDVLIKQDETKNGVYILESGEIQYSRMNFSLETNQHFKVPFRAISTPGYLVSSSSLLGVESAVTSYATKNSVILYIPDRALQSLCRKNPKFALRLQKRILWLINNQLRAVRTRLITTQFNTELLVAATLLSSNSAKLSVHSPLHTVPLLLENKLTMPKAFEILHEVELHGVGAEKNLASLCLDNLHQTQKEARFFDALQNIYSGVAESNESRSNEQVQIDCIAATKKAFSIPSIFVKGFENFPKKSGCVFIYNHLLNDEYYTLPNQFQITLDSHYLTYLLYEHYHAQSIRVVRIGRAEEFGHENYYEKLGFIDVYTKDSDARKESEEEKLARQKSFFDQVDGAIKEGKNLVISPEGASFKTEHSPAVFKSGIFKVIQKMEDEPYIVPIVVANFDKRITTHKFACEIKKPFKLSQKMAQAGTSDVKEFLTSYQKEYRGYVQELASLTALENSAQYLFEEEVKELKKKIKNRKKPEGYTAFYGSSTLRLWETMERDLSGKDVINFAFGGSTYQWCIHYFDFLFKDEQPTSYVLYGGDNDLSNGYSPEEVLEALNQLIIKIKTHSPEAPITIISIKPSPSREYIWGEIIRTNELIRKYAEGNDKMHWIDTFNAMLGSDGYSRTDLYVEDMLHLNEKGYEVWAEAVGSQLKY